MRVLAFTVALLAAALTAAPVLASDDPVNFSKKTKDDNDQLPNYNAPTTGEILGFKSNRKKPGGAGSIRATTGGKLQAQNVFIAASRIEGGNDEKVKNYPNVIHNWVFTDNSNSIICSLEFDFKSDNHQPILSKLHYHEHIDTKFAWLMYDFIEGSRRSHRLIFLNRACPSGYTDPPVDCDKDPNTIVAKTPNFEYTGAAEGKAAAAVQYCTDKLKYPFTINAQGVKEFGDGGGGGEM